ncbi:CCR4-NOT transcription complex subunit 1 [Nematocida minor]|uniref:CCR4-NOT transcription complex subunit 1 n=1 Tax=Nematocida minor TaxID=1912983 RepID=UPI00221E4851|nr:CCR4-NOT transcription complex subunit 1 [Nematocida minor]KAI5190217.1 CCR4-NOT transcription complex subunit 1 [Nematocida minor]
MWKEQNKSPQERDRNFSSSILVTNRDVFDRLKVVLRKDQKEKDLFVKTLLQMENPKDILIQIDSNDFLVASKKEASSYLEIWKKVTNEVYPYKKVLKRWSNAKAQAIFLFHLLSLPPDMTLIYRSAVSPLIDRNKDTSEYTHSIKEMAMSNYNCDEIFSLVGELDTEDGLSILSHGITSVPELVCLGLVRNCQKYDRLFIDTFSYCLLSNERSHFILRKIFEKKPKLTLATMEKLHLSSFSLDECLSACLECKILPYILRELEPLEFSLDLILLAISREVIDLSVILCMQPNDDFINSFIQHMIFRYGKGSTKGISIHPLTVDIILSTCISLEGLAKSLSKSTNMLLSKLKSVLIPEIRTCLVKRTTFKQQASEFLHNVISGRTANSDAIVYMTQISSNKNSYDTELFEYILNEMELKYNMLDRLAIHEVLSMALFYGRMIKYEILPSKRTKSAMRSVAMFLREDPCSNKFKFALKCLEAFGDVLEKYPFYAQEYSRMPQVYAANKSLYTFIRGHLSIQELSSKEETDGPLAFADLVLEILGKAEVHPNWQKSFNMLTSTNIQSVTESIKALKPSETDLARYIIAKRVFKETNHLRLYVQFILDYSDTLYLRVRDLFCTILRAYVDRHTEVDKSDKAPCLRVIGTYLGMLTFTDRVPILYSQFNVKDYLVESAGKEYIYSAVVFVCKYIEECTNSTILGKHSPYVMSILRVLSEIHFLAEGSDLISLEIEICFSKIELPIEDVYPDISVQEKRLGAKRKASGIANYIELEGIRSMLAHIAVMGLDLAVRDVPYLIVDKIFSISSRAASEAVKKDFPGNPSLAVEAYTNMVYELTASLAKASTAGPIKASAANNIAHFMRLAGMEDTLSNEKISNIVDKNLPICLGVVEYISRERVAAGLQVKIEELREEIAQLAPCPIPKHKVSLYLPKPYTKPSYITAEEIQTITVGEYHEICAYLSSINYKNRENAEALGPFTGSSAQKKWEDAQKILHEIEKVAEENVKSKLAIELLESMHAILNFVSAGANEMACLFFCQNIIGSIFMLSNRWARTVCIQTVYKICRLSYSSMREVSSWLIYAEDERKFNPKVIAQMLDHKIMNVLEYDVHLGSTLIRNNQRMKFAVELLRNCIITDMPIGNPFDYICTIEAISKTAKGPSDERIKTLLKEIAKRIFLTKKDGAEKELFDAWTDLYFCKVFGPERTMALDGIMSSIRERTSSPYDMQEFLKSAFSAAVECYLRARKECSPIKYLKIESLALLIANLATTPETLSECLSILSEIFLDGVDIHYYQIQALFIRLLQVLLENISISLEDVIFDFLSTMRPTSLGFFLSGFVELLFSDYIIRNMFLRNAYRGVHILQWTYQALRAMPLSSSHSALVYACSAFVLQLKKYAPNFYNHYSYLALLMVPISPSVVLLRSVWSLQRHPSYMELLLQHKHLILNTEYYSLLIQVNEELQKKNYDLLEVTENEELLSHILVDSLTNQPDSSRIYYDIILSLFAQPGYISFKEHILARLLEKSCAPPPRPLFVRKTLDALLNAQAYMESLGEIVRRDKEILGKLIIRASAVLATDETVN